MNDNISDTAQQQIGKTTVLTAVVRAFFKYFSLGIIEANSPDASDMCVYEPQNVKKAIVPHIETVSSVFNQEAFYAISRINYAEDEIEKELKAFVAAGNNTTLHDLVRFACRTPECYDAMVLEYKSNFESLLCGSFAQLAEHVEANSHFIDLGEMPVDRAEQIINRIASTAYQEGRKIAS